MKIRLATKNSVWKIVQNPLKNNYYTDIMDFENDEARGEFLNKYQFNGENDLPWDDLDAYIDTIVKWRDELHFSFTIDQSEVPFTRTEALRKDFCIIYDDNDKIYRFCTLQASFSRNEWQSTKLEYQGEMDVFFTYGIRNIWKENAEIQLERAIPVKQWDDTLTFPLVNITSELQFKEPFSLENAKLPIRISKNVGVPSIEGYIVFVKPQPRDLNLFLTYGNDTNAFKKQTRVRDTIAVYSQNVVNGVVNVYYILDYKGASRVVYHNYRTYAGVVVYEKDQMVAVNAETTTTGQIYKKDEQINQIFIPKDFAFFETDFWSSPDIVKILPARMSNNTLNFCRKADFFQINVGDLIEPYNHATVIKDGGSDNWAFQNALGLTMYVPPVNNYFVYEYNGSVSLTIPTVNSGDLYDKSQYAKISYSDNYSMTLTAPNKSTMIIFPELINAQNRTLAFRQTNLSTYEGIYALTVITNTNVNNVYSNGNTRNNYALEWVSTVELESNKNTFIEYASNNNQSINTNARLERKERTLSIVNGALNIASGAANAVSGAFLGKFGLAGTDFKDPKTSEFIGHGMTLQDNLNVSKGASEIGGSIEQIGRGITNIMNAANQIQRTTATLADASSGKNQSTYTGTLYTYLLALDGSPEGMTFTEWKPPEFLLEMAGNFYHRYGYSFNGLLKKPIEYLSNGRIFDYLQAEFTSVYSGLSENLSPQEAKIAAESISYGVRIWHYNDHFTTVGDYSKRNIQR